MTRRPIPLVLSGPPRSGTTLFSALLEGHPDINWLPDEGFFFEHLHALGRENFERFLRGADTNLEHLIDGIRDRSLMPITHRPLSDFPSLTVSWSEQEFRSVLASDRPRDVRELWNLLLDSYMAGLGYHPRRYVSMKAADFGRSVAGALGFDETARGVVIVRHPIDAINSLKIYRQRRGAKLLSWPTLVETIVDMNTLVRLVADLPADRFRVCRYEDFAGGSDAIMRPFCRWLDIEFDPVLLSPSMMGAAWSNNSSFISGEAGRSSRPERKCALSSEERDYVLEATAPFRSAYGY